MGERKAQNEAMNPDKKEGILSEGERPQETGCGQTEPELTEGTGEASAVKKHRIDGKYWKIGLVAFVVLACLILFYFALFQNHSLFGFFQTIWSLIQPFLVGMLLAYLLKPIVATFEKWTEKWFKKMKSRHKAHVCATRVSIAFTMILFFGFLYIIFAAIIPEVISSSKDLITNLPNYTEYFFDWLEGVAANSAHFHEKVVLWHTQATKLMQDTGDSSLVASATDWVTKYIEQNYNGVINGITSSIKGICVALMDILISTISCIYILAGRKKFGAQGKMIIYSIFPEKAADKVMEEVHYVDKMFTGFINGKILDSIIIGILCYIVMRILQIPYPLLVSVVVGVTNIIPFFGPFIGAIPSAFIILLVSPIKCLTFVIAIIVIQQLDGNVIGPKILGDTTGVSSFWVLFSITLFGGLWGVGGMVIGVPLFAVIYDIIRQLVVAGLKKRNKVEMYESYEKKEAGYTREKENKKKARKEKRRAFYDRILNKKEESEAPEEKPGTSKEEPKASGEPKAEPEKTKEAGEAKK